MKALPNILTGLRLVLSIGVFLILIVVSGSMPFMHPPATRAGVGALLIVGLVCFVVAAVTDFFDGWLARRYNAVSVTGAILDPIADKILVCGGFIGVVATGSIDVALPAGLILFREFSVSAMREVLAPRGIKLPVTFLAKTKTTIQLIAIIMVLILQIWASQISDNADLASVVHIQQFRLASYVMVWLAALVTVWTGIEYGVSARKALARDGQV